jgi:hypothetical protein
MINVQELFHEKMCKHRNQCLLFEQNMDLERKYTLNFHQNEILISDVFYDLTNKLKFLSQGEKKSERIAARFG